jgi:antitoxin HigA-1
VRFCAKSSWLLSATNLARALRVPVKRIAVIVNERGGISDDMARRLGRYFKTAVTFWMNLQAHYVAVSTTLHRLA